MGSSAQAKESAALRQQAQANIQKAVAELEKVDLPDIEKQRLALEIPKLLEIMQAEQLGPSALEDIEIDPRLKQAQMQALEELSQRGEVGLTAEDRARFRQLRRQTSADEQARQASLLQEFRQRGISGGGSELAARLSSSQSATDRATQAADQLAAEAAAARRQALAQSANVAGSIGQQEFQRQATQAQAADLINQFNLQQRASATQRNVGERQRIGEAGTQTRNVQQQFNTQLGQRQYENELRRAQAIAGARTGAANLLQSQAAQVASEKRPNVLGAIGTAIGAGAGLAAGGGAQGASIGGQLGGTTFGAFGYKDGGVKKYADNSMRNRSLLEQRDFEEGVVRDDGLTKQEFNKARNQEEEQNTIENLKALASLSKSIGQNLNPEQNKMPSYSPISLNLPEIQSQITEPINTFKVRDRYSYADGGMRVDEQINNGTIGVNSDAQDELLEILKGNIPPEKASGEPIVIPTEDTMPIKQTNGRVVPGDSFFGDNLPDRINSGEMVSNVEMQDRGKKLIEQNAAEVEGFRKLLRMLGKNNA